jgi:hypothetical protein
MSAGGLDSTPLSFLNSMCRPRMWGQMTSERDGETDLGRESRN